jgi:hypothetical protein
MILLKRAQLRSRLWPVKEKKEKNMKAKTNSTFRIFCLQVFLVFSCRLSLFLSSFSYRHQLLIYFWIGNPDPRNKYFYCCHKRTFNTHPIRRAMESIADCGIASKTVNKNQDRQISFCIPFYYYYYYYYYYLKKDIVNIN